jgi:tRNA(adenine34) deaminase
MTEQDFMEEAYREAVAAGGRGECPVGAVLVKDGKIVARAGNQELEKKDPTAHAEMLCLRRAGQYLGTHVLSGCIMYTTLWPCPMCQGAMLQAQVARVVSGSTTFRWIMEVRFNQANLEKIGPVREAECRALFIDWAAKNGRLEILEMEEILPS